jgi:hypothetical protein
LDEEHSLASGLFCLLFLAVEKKVWSFGKDANRKTAWMQVSAAHALCAKRLPCAAKAN